MVYVGCIVTGMIIIVYTVVSTALSCRSVCMGHELLPGCWKFELWITGGRRPSPRPANATTTAVICNTPLTARLVPLSLNGRDRLLDHRCRAVTGLQRTLFNVSSRKSARSTFSLRPTPWREAGAVAVAHKQQRPYSAGASNNTASNYS